ncbi:MAG: suppressor of fused domain protein [Promethearchaeota archaeon]
MRKRKKQERAESGEPIYRYKNKELNSKDFNFAIGVEENIEAITLHIKRNIGSIDNVLHEIISDVVHIDVHVVSAYDFDAKILITSGMSDIPMNAPKGCEDLKYAELMFFLPNNWPLTFKDFKKERNYWPIRNIKFIARFPHIYKAWIWEGHSIPFGDPPEPYSEKTELCCLILVPPLLLDEKAWKLEKNGDKCIYFFALMPLYKEEMEYKLKHGYDALMERMLRDGDLDITNFSRKNYCL